MRIYYIHHDSFLLRSIRFNAVFDYYMPPPGHVADDVFKLIDPAKPLYVVVSHHHKDHYSPEIFEWHRRFPHIRYILSRDTFMLARKYFSGTHYRGARRVEQSLVTELRPGAAYEDALLRLEAFGSTDIGNSYVLIPRGGPHAGEGIFFAGDLNAWTWRDESTHDEVEKAISDFTTVLDEVAAAGHRRFAVAMFPVDARTGSGFHDGAGIFLQRFDAGVFIPMHFGLAADGAEAHRFRMHASEFGLYKSERCAFYVRLSPFDSIDF